MKSYESLKLAWRRMSREWTFLGVVVLTMGLGIGVTTSVFSVVQGVLLDPLPYPQPEQLISVWHTAPGLGLSQLECSDASYLHYREHSETLEELAIYYDKSVPLAQGDRPEQLPASFVSASLFGVLRTMPAAGRPFEDRDMAPGAEPVVIISHDLWERRFGADAGLLGVALEVDGVSRQLVGIMPPGFGFPDPSVDLWMPASVDPAAVETGRFSYLGIARMRDGVDPDAVRRELDVLLHGLPEAYGGQLTSQIVAEAGLATLIHPYRDEVVGEVEGTLWILLAAAGVVLLLASFNVANLLLVRAEGRRQEIAVRQALGSSFSDLVRDLLAESLLISLLGGALATGVAFWAVEILRIAQPPSLPRLEQVRVDLPVLAFAAGLVVLCCLALASISALRQRAGGPLTSLLAQGGRSASPGRRHQRFQAGLVAAQVALSTVLLIGSGLLLKSFHHLTDVDPGFQASGALSFRIALPEARYAEPEAALAFYRGLEERLRAIPGVLGVGGSRSLPLVPGRYSAAQSFADQPAEPGEPPRVFPYTQVLPGYFQAMGIPLVAGRPLEASDLEAGAAPAVVISQELARRVWPGQSALGKKLQPGQPEEPPAGRWYTVVGVAGDVRDRSLAQEPSPLVYYPPIGRGEADAWIARDMRIVLRTAVPPLSVADEIRGAVWEMDRGLPLAELSPLETIVRRSRAGTSFAALLLALAAGLALLLSTLGLYGTVSHLTALHRRGMAIRLALGARKRSLMSHVLMRSLLLAAVGIALGVPGALALTRYLESLLYEVSPTDPTTVIAVAGLLLWVAAVAAYLPARKVAQLDPVDALRDGQ